MSLQPNALTTRERLIAFAELGTLTSAQGTVLDSIINAVSDYVENYCQRTFKQTTYTNEEYDGQDSQFLIVKNYPITTFSQLQERTGASSWDTIGSDLYVVNLNTGVISLDSIDTFRSTRKGTRFIEGSQNYRVTYTSGYVFENADSQNLVTLESVGLGDLEYAVWKLAISAWNQRKGSSDIKSEKLGDYSVTYRKETMMDPELQGILDKYTRESDV